jgi:hypothetical protein
MALHNELPIYKVAYDLLGLVTTLRRGMPRDVKQDFGSAISRECVKIVVLIFRANVAREKAPHLLELIERLEVVNLLLRLSRDLRFIATKHYSAAIALTGSIGKQANGWRRSASSPVA